MLIVDDDVRNVFALTSALEMHGMTVLYADNGADGIRMLTEHPDVDIVLMDAMMPEQDGNETTRAIRRNQRFAELPVVFLTAKAMPGDRESSLAAGASDYITKPVDLDELLDVDGVLGQRRGPGGLGAGVVMTALAKVLLVDDRRDNLLALEAILQGLPVRAGRRGERRGGPQAAARRRLRGDPARRADAGRWTASRPRAHIKRRERTRHVPIIFLTAADRDAHLALRGYAAGAVDYLTKPFDPWVLRAKVSVFVELWTKTQQLHAQTAAVRIREAESRATGAAIDEATPRSRPRWSPTANSAATRSRRR